MQDTTDIYMLLQHLYKLQLAQLEELKAIRKMLEAINRRL